MDDSDSTTLGSAILNAPTGRIDAAKRSQEASPRQRSRSITWGAQPMQARESEVGAPPLDAEDTIRQGRRRSRPPLLSLPHAATTPSPPETLSAGSSTTKVSDEGSSSPTGVRKGSNSHVESGIFAASPEQEFTLEGAEGRDWAEPSGETAIDDSPKGIAIEHLVAVHAKEYERYSRGYCYPPSYYKADEYVIDEGPVAMSFERPPPTGWTTYIHPEGTRYFYHDDPRSASNEAPVPVITEAWLHDGKIQEQVEKYMHKTFKYMADAGLVFRVRVETPTQLDDELKLSACQEGSQRDYKYIQDAAPVVLVLEVRLTGNVGYYFVDHPRQRLFWLEKFDFSWEVAELRINHNNASIGLEMRSHYWKHNDYFPHLYELTDKDIVTIDDMITFTLGDSLTSDTSAVNSYGREDLKLAQNMVSRHEQRTPDRRKQSVGERRTLFRVVSTLSHERFLNLHGERGARLDSKQSIHYSLHRRRKWVTKVPPQAGSLAWYRRLVPYLFAQQQDDSSSLEVQEYVDPESCAKAKEMQSSSFCMNVVTIIMFGGPYVHANRLKDITLDGIVNKNLLAKYTERMVAEWRDVALYGTVLLGANVSFLTIQSVDSASEGKPNRTPAQRASYFSILASLGTVVSSLVLLILVRHREVMGNKMIQRRSQSRWDLETLAVMYGTPFSLVIWSILGFFVSFAILWSDPDDYVVIGIVVVSCVSFAIFLGWAVSASYSEVEPYRFIARAAKDKVKAAGQTARKETLEMAEGVAGRVSTVVPARWRRKRSRSQDSGYTAKRCASPTSLDDRPGKTTPESLELGNRNHGKDSMV